MFQSRKLRMYLADKWDDEKQMPAGRSLRPGGPPPDVLFGRGCRRCFALGRKKYPFLGPGGLILIFADTTFTDTTRGPSGCTLRPAKGFWGGGEATE